MASGERGARDVARTGARLSVDWLDELVVALAFAAETALAVTYAGGHIGPGAALSLHGLAVLAMCAWVWSISVRRRDAALPLLATIATAILGPLGALGAHGVHWLSGWSRERPELLDEWYQRIAASRETDPATRLADDIRIGRSIDPAGAVPPSFMSVMQIGTTAEQQAVLGIIARHFHFDYLPALELALQSPTPVVRVQAAAVAARVRGPLQDTVAALILEASSNDAPLARRLEIAAQLQKSVAGGLIDESVQRRAAGATQMLMAGAIGTIRHDPAVARRLQPAAVDALERGLIAAGEFAVLRSLRTPRRYQARGARKIRLARWPKRPSAVPMGSS